ncbi:MAG TPA: DUF1565 domain-containing protein, partial [bacterium]|nr:DUF1565 domain-containing protein [bacterium]
VAIYIGNVQGALVDSIRMSEQARYSNIRLSTSTDAVVENCNFSATGNPVGRGLEIVFDDVGTVVRDCTLSGFYDGLFFNGTSNAKVETCVLQYNVEGVDLCCLESPGHNPNPDFGGGARSSLGGNIISENVIRGILNESYNTIYAKYNIWGHTPPMIGPATGSDIYSISTGSVIWE